MIRNRKSNNEQTQQECAEIFSFIKSKGEITREQITKQLKTRDGNKLSLTQMRRRLQILLQNKVIHYERKNGSVYWLEGRGEIVIRTPSNSNIGRPSAKVIRCDYSDMSKELRIMAGYI